MFILIGSRALEFYGKLYDRIPSDWDFLGNRCVHKQNIEIHDINNPDEPTSLEIYQYLINNNNIVLTNTPLGNAIVAPLSIQKVLKLSSLPINKFKHEHDLNHLREIMLTDYEKDLVKRRTIETETRIKKQKEKFFNKYHIDRFFEHDVLHKFINDTPEYLKIISDTSQTEVSEISFFSLSDEQKKFIIWEEAFVLALERILIPQLRNSPMFMTIHIDNFRKVEKSIDPAIKWLDRLSIPGRLKDHPDFIANWSKNNYQYLLNGYKEWWNNSIDRLSVEFWKKVLTFEK